MAKYKAIYGTFDRGEGVPRAGVVEFVPEDTTGAIRENFDSIEDARFLSIVKAWPFPIYREVPVESGSVVVPTDPPPMPTPIVDPEPEVIPDVEPTLPLEGN